MICVNCDRTIFGCICADIDQCLQSLIENGNSFARRCAETAMAERKARQIAPERLYGRKVILDETWPEDTITLIPTPLLFEETYTGIRTDLLARKNAALRLALPLLEALYYGYAESSTDKVADVAEALVAVKAAIPNALPD